MTKAIEPVNTPLSEEETRAILTPFAFKIDKTLFGLSLAKPWKRGVALLIDLLIIALLSDAPGELLAIVIAITLYRLGSKKRAQQQGIIKGAKRRAVLRGLGIFIIFVMLLEVLPSMFNSSSDNERGFNKTSENIDDVQIVALFAKNFSQVVQSDCDDLFCWEKEFSTLPEFLNALPDQEIKKSEAKRAIKELVNLTDLKQSEAKQLRNEIFRKYQLLKTKKQSSDQQKSKQQITINDDKNTTLITNILSTAQQEKINKPIYSVKKLIKGIIDDLGLGFGWAAFYFTIFTALWHGQTLGKKLLKIKVLQLDGTPLTLMDSFGRYGGYGAGIATGLLGFIQIYWDPNRQAIHDKISATVVVNVNASNKVNMTQKSE